NAMDDPTGEHPYSWSVAEEPDNRELNRYSNILPYNQTRVLLAPIRDPDTGAIIHGDYINASWVRPPGGIRSYIATQGPLKRTIVDFWRMVWQEKVRVLVMLTDVYERGKVKCNVYWPERVGDEKALNGEAVLRRMEITRRPPILNTTVVVVVVVSVNPHLGDEPAVQRAIITQIHFLGWPDHGVPEQPDGVLRLVRLVNRDKVPATLVHCSAGCGRTGTFCVIDSAIAILTATRDGSVDLVHQLTRHFRTQRCTMVQTSQQYWFCYVAVLR
ncbi:protein-tyrosine phosphatase-like protein, partial [Syncephalis plumigaleata]